MSTPKPYKTVKERDKTLLSMRKHLASGKTLAEALTAHEITMDRYITWLRLKHRFRKFR